MGEAVQTIEGDVDPCGLPKQSGYCFAYFENYYYDTLSEQCEQFVYGGCGGNENNFGTKADCEAQCVNKPMFGVNSLKAKKETTALSAANKAEINEIGTASVALMANWAGIISTGQGLVGLTGGDHGASIKINNYLCGGELRADGVFHLVKGSFKAHCESVPSGRSAGCTATGVWNRGLYGVIQYDFYTAVEGYEHCRALNIFVQASQGWFGPKKSIGCLLDFHAVRK